MAMASALLLMLLSLLVPAAALTYAPLTLEYAPSSGAFTLLDSNSPAVFSWTGQAVLAPAPAPEGSLLVNAVGNSTGSNALSSGVTILPSSTATQGVVPAAMASWADLSPEAQQALNDTAEVGNLTANGDAVSIVAYATNSGGGVGIAPLVWSAKQYAQRPLMSFVSDRLVCDATIPGARQSSFLCRSLLPRIAKDGVQSYTFKANISSAMVQGSVDDELSSTRVRVQLSIVTSLPTAEPDPTDAIFADLISVMYTKAYLLGQQHADIMHLRSQERTRRSSARIAVAFLWVFIMITVACAVFLFSVWFSWAMPYAGNRCLSLKAITGIFLSMAALYTILGTTTGLAGFVILLVLQLLATAILSMAYCCLRARNRDRDRSMMRPVGALLASDNPNGLGSPSAALGGGGTNGNKRGSIMRSSITGNSAIGGSAPVAPVIEEESPTQQEQEERRQHKAHHQSRHPLDDDRVPLTGIAPLSDAAPSLVVLRNAYNRWPDSLGSKQRCLAGHSAMAFLVGAVVCVAIFGLWSVDDYTIWQRATGGPVVEFMPQSIAKATFIVYAYDGFADRIKMNDLFFDVSTQWCGRFYSTRLSSDMQKYNSIYMAFIDKYDIDMNLFEPSDYTQYNTVNEWFTRHLKPGQRVLAAPTDETVLVQPCDARALLFAHVPADSFVWIKDTGYTVEGLIGAQAYGMASDSFADGSMALLRLAPQDYHRLHSPVTGRVLADYTIEGTFHSVNADGMTSRNYAIYNQRRVLVLDTAGYANIGRVAYVAIGALCVGSITFVPAVGDLVSKGDDLGYFQFGGSTVAVIFERRTVQFEQDILEHSAMRIETLVQQGARMAVTVR